MLIRPGLRFDVAAVVCTASLAMGALSALVSAERPDAAKWEAEIAALERADKTNPPPSGAILFAGSSSIRLWKTLAEDFPRHRVINRGFGGSHISDNVAYADRIILPAKPKLVLLYAGDNDLAANKTPDQALADFQAFTKKVHSAQPSTRILLISIKPSISRWHLADKVKAANRLIEGFTQRDARLGYIDVFTPMLGADGQPRPEIFLDDKLHMNAQGYALWRRIIAPRLDEAMR